VGGGDAGAISFVFYRMTIAAVALFAVLLLALTLENSFELMLWPRRVIRQIRFVSLFYRLT
jgi:hypothetical protein